MHSFQKELTGSKKQIEWASRLRNDAAAYVWEQGWHGTFASFGEDMEKLPTSATWWIENRIANSAHEAVRKHLGLEYLTPVGADY